MATARHNGATTRWRVNAAGGSRQASLARKKEEEEKEAGPAWALSILQIRTVWWIRRLARLVVANITALKTCTRWHTRCTRHAA